jgi:hypothetical protein
MWVVWNENKRVPGFAMLARDDEIQRKVMFQEPKGCI